MLAAAREFSISGFPFAKCREAAEDVNTEFVELQLDLQLRFC